MKKYQLILDTDIGSDCDDVMALAYLVYAQRYRNAEIKAVAYSNRYPHGPAAIRTFFRDLGEEVPPIGIPSVSITGGDHFCRQIVEKFGSDEDVAFPYEDAVTVMRRALAESEDGCAVICAVGALTNVAALLKSEGDGISPLSGVEMVAQKCEKVVLMAGIFAPGDERVEWNVHLDVPAVQTIVDGCPVPLVFLPNEAGKDMMTGGPVMEKYGENTPLSLAFMLYPGVREAGGRHSWDPATCVYALEGCLDFFTESEPGVITVNEQGRTFFTPSEGGKHHVLYIREEAGRTVQDGKDAVAAYIDRCAMTVCEEREALR